MICVRHLCEVIKKNKIKGKKRKEEAACRLLSAEVLRRSHDHPLLPASLSLSI